MYNLSNIIECLLNICELRCSLTSRDINIDGTVYSFDKLCDELALKIAIDPKIIIQDIRKHITFVVRRAGTMGNKITYVSHEHGDPVTGLATDKYTMKEFAKERMDKFNLAKTTQSSYAMKCWRRFLNTALLEC